MRFSHPYFRSSLSVATAPTIEPVTVDELRTHSRIDSPDEDAVLSGYIKAARLMVEEDAQLALLTQTLQLKMDFFPDDLIELRRPPVTAISSIIYTDTDAVSQTWDSASYVLDTGNRPGRVTLAYNESWPSTYSQANVVTVTFIAGATLPALVDERAKQAIRLLAGWWANNRETAVLGSVGGEIAMAYTSLINSLRWSGYR